MRGLIVMAMFLASFADAAWKDYTSVRELSLDADGIEQLQIDAGAGSLEIQGVSGLERIVVVATVVVPESDDNKASKLIEKKLHLSLDARGDRAKLDAFFDKGFLGMGPNASVDLEIRVPAGMAIEIDDGAGWIAVMDTAANLSIDDGSGSIEVRGAADISIDDGSGSIDVSAAAGNVSIVDGSGSIKVRLVEGSVTIDDGSGSIEVGDVAQDLVLLDDGSGSVSYSGIGGAVRDDS